MVELISAKQGRIAVAGRLVATLLAECRSRPMNAWHRKLAILFEKHSRHLVSLAARRVQDREVAGEIVQDVYTRMLQAGSSGGGDNDDTKILYAAVRNAVTDHRRSSHRRQHAMNQVLPNQLGHVLASSPEEQVGARRALSTLDKALMELRPQAREIFLLHRVKGVPNAEIARRYRISVSAVEKQLARVMRHCQRHLAEHINEP